MNGLNELERKMYEEEERRINMRVRGTSAYLASVKTALAFFSLSPSHLFSMVEASTVRNVAPPYRMMEV